MIMRNKPFILIFALLIFSQGVFAQDIEKSEYDVSKTSLIDLHQWIGADEGSMRIDNFVNVVKENPKSKGFFIVYCGKTCQYGEIEAHIRGINAKLDLKLKDGFRGVEKNQFLIVAGGYREKTQTEFWFVPENDCPPIPSSTVKIEDVNLKGIFKRNVMPYECC